jgi:hypothetical protein
MEANMDAAFSFLISIGIIAFGIWMVAATFATGALGAHGSGDVRDHIVSSKIDKEPP